MGIQFNKKSIWFIAYFLITLSFLPSENLRSAEGGLPGTGDLNFDPAFDTENNICYNPFGIDNNSLEGISEQVVGLECHEVNSGEFWVAFSQWFTNTTTDLPPSPIGLDYGDIDYPADYLPSFEEPMDDFLSKLVAVKYVIDGRKTYSFPPEDIGIFIKLNEIAPITPAVPDVIFLGKLPPQRIGDHVVQVIFTMSERHCAGFAAGKINPIYPRCLEAGDNYINQRYRYEFAVTPKAAQSHF